MAAVDDATLVTRAKAGDRQAFGALVVRHTRAMLAVARAYFASEADAQDAVQDAFVKGFTALDQLESPARFAGWVTRITVNTCIDILRTRSDKLSLTDFSSSALVFPRLGQQHPTPATLASKAEGAELVKAAVGRLPPQQRVALMLRYGAGMSYNGMADYLDVPLSTVDGRVRRAKRALREILEPLGLAES